MNAVETLISPPPLIVAPEHVPVFQVRLSRIQGQGVFARSRILKGTRIIEYTGERITHREADARYDEEAMEHPHTVLFTVDKKTVIDAGVGGNEARFINHSCAPNCEAVNEDGHIFIDALCDILPGEELTYDYHLEYQGRYRAEWKERYACRCGCPSCRGTLLLPKRRRSQRRRKR
ncbi:MAG TPA: SET domain-containing protein-lysine N-methyltransferase [Anaerolineae bacterium]